MATELTLRSYQAECADAVWSAWGEGMQRPAVVLPTGSGKTVIFSHLAQQFIDINRETGAPYRVVILVHRDELADQAIDKIRTVAPRLVVGKVKAADDEIHADVMVCSVQTLARTNRLSRLMAAQTAHGRIGLVITDECFPAGTLVGGTPIEKLRRGDLVPTWNEDTGREELRPVVRVMRKIPSAMVRVSLADGKSFTCTPNHPILTDAGWCPAGMLPRGASIVSFTHDDDASGNDLHGVWGNGDPDGESADRQLPAERPGVLLRHLPGHLGTPGFLGTDGPDEPGARLEADAAEQPHAPDGVTGQDGADSAPYRAQAASAGRERYGSDQTAAEACGVPGLGDGIGRGSGGRGPAVPLPDGHRASVHEGGRGGGRGIPFLAGPPSLRPEEGRTAVLTRVAGVQVLEPGSHGTYGGVCPDGAVYNIEVDTTHTYLIGDGVVVHNCHHAAADSYRQIMNVLGCHDGLHDYDGEIVGTRTLGVTATLARGDGVGLGDIWEDVVFRRSVLWMISRGYLTDVRGKAVDLDRLHLGDVKRSGGDYQAKDLGKAIIEADGPKVVARAVLNYAADRRPIVFLPDVASARATTLALVDAGISAETIDGGVPREERLAIYRRYRTGETRAIVNCMVLTEGADFPWADCVAVARPTTNPVLYVQMVGRGLRPWPGKTDCLVLDVTGVGGKLSTLIDLTPGEVTSFRNGESLGEAAVREAGEGDATVTAPGSVAFNLKHRDLDLFKGSSHAWLRTPGGVMFIPVANEEVFVWPTADGTWDVCFAPVHAKWIRLHTGLPLGTAQAWAETEAEDRMPFNGMKDADWRKRKAESRQIAFARSMGVEIGEDPRKGVLSDAISVAKAGQKFDGWMRKAEK
jgi:superfamily II DNA or RNA helicase